MARGLPEHGRELLGGPPAAAGAAAGVRAAGRPLACGAAGAWVVPASPARALVLLVALLASVALLAARGADVAAAHGETSPLIQTVVDGVDPAVPGLSARTAPGLPTQLTIVNRTATDVEVLGMSGRPFLRIGARGVFADVANLAWYRSGNPDSVFVAPEGIRLGGPPRWVRVSTQAAWSFFDFRLRPSTVRVPETAREGRQPVRLDSWSVPLRYGGRTAAVRGHVEFVPIVGEVVPALSSPTDLGSGITVALLGARVPGLYLTNSGRVPVTVLGRTGEPFARIGPRGAEVNVHSPTYAEGLVVQGDRVRDAVDPRAAPRWRRVSDQPSYGWLDLRLRYPRAQPPEDVVRADRRVELMRWSVPIRDGARTLEVRGATSWVPLAATAPEEPAGGPGPGTWLAGVGAAVLATALAAVALRRRRGRAAPVGRAARPVA